MNINPKIAVVDYGIGNLFSISRAVARFTDSFVVTDDPGMIRSSEKVILPGVGSFEAGMMGLKLRGLENIIKEFAETGRPILGICLGAQLLLSEGHEFGKFKGLNIIPGRVTKFSGLDKGTKVPHIGWNHVKVSRGASKERIFKSVPENSNFYFIHSFTLNPDHEKNILSSTNYGGKEFCSAVYSGNVYGTQFHPEKSGQEGLKLIGNFVNLPK